MSSDPTSDDFVYVRPDTDIHLWFELTYANYLVLPRSVLQSMPEEWQFRFTELLDEMRDRYDHLEWPAYEVRALRRHTELVHEYGICPECDGECTKAISAYDEIDCPACDGTGHTDEIVDTRYETGEEVGYRTDPIPHYNRGRTVIPPKEEA